MSTRFRLGVVLRLRELAEDAARARLGSAIDAHRRATDILIELVDRELGAQRRLEAHQARATAGELMGAQVALEHAERATATGRTALEAAAEGLMEARSVLADATRRREVVERLRDRAAHAAALAAQRREDALLSEIAGTRHARLAAEGDR